MPIGEFLTRKKLVDEGQVELAVERQKIAGGLLGDNLVELGFINRDKLNSTLQGPPAAPKTVEETGLDWQFLTNLLLKSAYMLGLESGGDLASQMKLPVAVVESMLNDLRKLGLVELRGSSGTNFPVMMYSLTANGRNRAIEAVGQSGYVGPAPVSLESYLDQVEQQCITNDRIDSEKLTSGFSHLVLTEEVLRRLGPAVNSGKAILLYGPPGNGKTSISEAVGKAFRQSIFVPHCIEVDGQVIKIYDPIVHQCVPEQKKDSTGRISRSQSVDPRWVKCRRPVIITGGELTLEMLDLDFDPISKYYEAPPQLKAIGGIFIIDDFGRQLVPPRELLNRWIIPLEKKVDYLTIHTGKKFQVPFDELVIFSTNIPPQDLMDPALLRRVHYKIRLDPPSPRDYTEIFHRVCRTYKLDLPENLLPYLLEDFYPRTQAPLAAFHPKFIVEHVIASCNYQGVPPTITLELVMDALANLLISDGDGDSNRRLRREQTALLLNQDIP